MSRYDYVVVGGGSAGCIAAAELGRAGASVLLLEAGPAAEEHPATLDADGYKETFINDAVFFDRFTVPQPHCGGQRVFIGTGRVMGGSGSVNGMVYTRGAREDYDEWPEGWRWDQVVADFEAIEGRLRPRRREPTAWTSACVSAAEAAGFRHREDLNDGDLGGVIGHEWMNYEGDRRRSSYVAFLGGEERPAKVTVISGAEVHRIVVADGRAVAVEYVQGGEGRRAEVAREVVMAAGALETPKLLMLSGIGPGEAIRAVGLPVVADVPGVGQELHDHPNVPVFFRSRHRVDALYPQLYSFYRTCPESHLPEGQADSCYVYWPAPSAMKQAMQRVLPGMLLPPRLYHGAARGWVRKAVGGLFGIGAARRAVDHLFGIIVILGKPRSRGFVRLASADPRAQALVNPAYLADPEDRRVLARGVEVARRIAASGDLREWVRGELSPGPIARSQRALERWVGKNLITTYHFAATCRMGAEEAAPADVRLRLRGLRGVRIADASAIPSTPVSALNAPSMLVGYRAARYALEEASGE
ncbi:MAG: GMC family oxidoreductase [Myxococcales bacterium]|nr:GMC family oxidoreductase [Myxococcales bacterium]